MDWSWITTTWSAALMSVLSAVGIYAAVIAYTRIAGLRSFSKMSSFDFAMTVAIGSIVASTIVSRDPPLLRAVVALGALYGLQVALARLRLKMGFLPALVDNRPMVLMENGRMIEEAMRAAKVSRLDLIAKLREANVFRLAQVRVVVLETTGDFSVLHAPEEDAVELEGTLLEGADRRTTDQG